MFEKEAEEYADCFWGASPSAQRAIKQAFQAGAEFCYNNANEWHRVSDKLPAMDVFVYLWKKGDDFPVVACRHIFRGHKEWAWYCMWGSGFTISQLKGKDYLWKEIVLPKEIKND